MPNIDATRLEATGTRIFAAMGAPAADAAWISMLLVRANLRGHDSHGVIRIPQYWASVRDGVVDPLSPVTVTMETPVMARLDGGRGFGQPVARRGMEMAIAKAKAAGLSAVTLANTSHVGRLADYAEMAAREGLIGMLWVNAVHGLNVAPWGGAARRLGTNPHAIAVPGPDGPAMVLDFATSVVAEGKMRVKKNRKQQAPPGWFLDPGGRPHTDPEVFYGDPPGSLLAAGDHKGYGLSLAVEILGGIVSGTGPAGPGKGIFANGTLMICLDTSRFLPPADFDKQVAALFEWVKSAPLAQGATEILIPGEPEARLEAERRRDGIPVEDETWSQIQAAAKDLGVSVVTVASARLGRARPSEPRSRSTAPSPWPTRRCCDRLGPALRWALSCAGSLVFLVASLLSVAAVNFAESQITSIPPAQPTISIPGRAPDAIGQARQRALAPIPRAPGLPAPPSDQWVPERRVFSSEYQREIIIPGHYETPDHRPAIHRADAPRLRHARRAAGRDPRRRPPARRPAPRPLSRMLKKAHLRRYGVARQPAHAGRARAGGEASESGDPGERERARATTPRRLPSGAASHLDLFEHPARRQ